MKALVVETQKLRENLKIVREIISKNNKDTKLIAVVKGNGYGLGLVDYAQFLIDGNVTTGVIDSPSGHSRLIMSAQIHCIYLFYPFNGRT